MLISDKYEFVVALPTKCGTHSMRNMGLKWPDTFELCEWPELRHRMVPPRYAAKYKRAIVLRDPYDRLVSAFNYLVAHRNEWYHDELQGMVKYAGPAAAFQWWGRTLMDERAFAGDFKDPHGHRPYIWTDRLMDCTTALRGAWGGDPEGEQVWGLRLEHLVEDWHSFLVGVAEWDSGGGDLPTPGHYNKASVRNGGEVVAGLGWYQLIDGYPPDNRLVEWLETDAEWAGYMVRESVL